MHHNCPLAQGDTSINGFTRVSIFNIPVLFFLLFIEAYCYSKYDKTENSGIMYCDSMSSTIMCVRETHYKTSIGAQSTFDHYSLVRF
jgi:hypothetical protein